MREHNNDKHAEREHHQDLPLARRQITIRVQQTLYETVEELHAALDSDAAHLCFAISAVRGVLCHDLPNHNKPVQAPLFS
jgi:hypothetical protein